jgi:hypothetical protein
MIVSIGTRHKPDVERYTQITMDTPDETNTLSSTDPSRLYLLYPLMKQDQPVIIFSHKSLVSK